MIKRRIDEEMERQIIELVNLGVLKIIEIKGVKYYKDSDLSNQIDNMTSREAFLLGVKIGKNGKQKN